jgi:tRNA1Val (adenine37-N6)-methyltransferase
MSTSGFRFKRFEIRQDLCAMKVGTDGVLLGAWTGVDNPKKILDVGTGTGLIAIMLAQRTEDHPETLIHAVEIDTNASRQAKENAEGSPWADRISIFNCDFNLFELDNLHTFKVKAESPDIVRSNSQNKVSNANLKFDIIVSNPPFFRNSLNAPDKNRNQARHDDSLTWEQLISKSASLLSDKGHFSIIIPAEQENIFTEICWEKGLLLTRRCEIITKPGAKPKRVMLEFSFYRSETEHTRLEIQSSDNIKSKAFNDLTSGFYL